ncbi:YraN family protein [Cronbergia sp. UHCC 0137]|uniref:YraN family protein n=1 Tax=Cronbergia sp. UHCC 0137 TaxID=3110239 RepID=UPI002B219053|nr:YraN family protein [Cronbergia sp. UHCC 0137]MEA5618205.1 YraN family protein [Cronbergia sp. UHCC 0137]
MSNSVRSNYPDIGDLGEDLVAQWLHSTGWEILHRRFYCRWGEIDIIAQYHQTDTQAAANILRMNRTENLTLAFVEVKTRSAGNWDDGGRNAITQGKKTKIWRTAEIFLAEYPEKADYPCRFDVAIVSCQRRIKNLAGGTVTQEPILSLSTDKYEFKLQEYIPAAFEY